MGPRCGPGPAVLLRGPQRAPDEMSIVGRQEYLVVSRLSDFPALNRPAGGWRALDFSPRAHSLCGGAGGFQPGGDMWLSRDVCT